MAAQTFRTTVLPAACVYLGALAIGLTMVSFPSSSAVLKQAHGLTDAEYGAIFFPQLVAAILGALVGGAVTDRLSLGALFRIALAAFALAEALLAGSQFMSRGWALTAVMAGTGLFGLGFGLGGGPSNALAGMLFPRRASTAITAVHMTAGAGLMAGPAFFAFMAQNGHWIAGPLSVLGLSLAALAASLLAAFPNESERRAAAGGGKGPFGSTFFWLTAVVAAIYSVSEGTFSNWIILFLQEERSLSAYQGALALTCFWAALTLGRLAVSFLVIRVPATVILLVLPVAIAIAFWLLPSVSTASEARLAFGFAGLACSGFFPMLVVYASRPFPNFVSIIVSIQTAGAMIGVGLGSYLVGVLRSHYAISDLYHFAVAYPIATLGLLLLSLKVRPSDDRRGAGVAPAPIGTNKSVA